MKIPVSFFQAMRGLGLIVFCAVLAGCYSRSYNAPIYSVTGQPINQEPEPATPQPNTPPAQPVAPPSPTEPVPSTSTPPPASVTPAEPVQPTQPVVKKPDPPASNANATSTPRDSAASSVTWKWPAKGDIIQRFSARDCQNSPNQIGGGCGIDIAGEVGQPIYAATAGRVNYAGNGIPGLGNLIIISNSKGYILAYAHLQKIQVRVNDYVQAGQRIGTMGKSDADSPRLHIEVRRNGDPQDPLTYLPQP